jgi:hypothetical protein
MTSSPRAGRPPFQLATSRLGQSLLRLHHTLEDSRDEEKSVETLLSSWQKRWSTRRDEIARRLETIERQLEQVGRLSQPAPRLSLVPGPVDLESARSQRVY